MRVLTLLLPGLLVLATTETCFAQYTFGPSIWLEPDTTCFQARPSIAIDSDGNPCIVWMTFYKGDIRFAKSNDGGETFLPSVLVDTTNYILASPKLALDPDDNPHVTWTNLGIDGQHMGIRQVRYTRSTDKGQSFLPSIYAMADTVGHHEANCITVDSDGNPMIVWRGYYETGVDDIDMSLHFTRSYDGGLSFEPSIRIDPYPGYQMAGDIGLDHRQNIYICYVGDHWACFQYVFMVRSMDGGQTFSDRVQVDRDTSCGNGGTSIALVPSRQSPWAGGTDVLIAWEEDRPQPAGGVYLSRSTDGGETFGDIVTVSESQWGHSGALLAADSLGNNLTVLWRGGDLVGGDLLRYSCSTDGGSTFLPEAIVDSVHWPSQRFPDLAATGSGVPMVAWRDTRPPHDTLWQIYFAKGTKVGIQETPVFVNEPLRFRLGQNYPNPFSDFTTISYTIPDKRSASLNVYDSSGRLMRKLVDDEKSAGSYCVIWDGKDMSNKHLPAGVYFYRLQAGELTTTRKMILIR